MTDGGLRPREIPVQVFSPGEPVPGLPGPVAGLLAFMEAYDSVVDTRGLTRTFGVKPTSLESFARGMLAGSRG